MRPDGVTTTNTTEHRPRFSIHVHIHDRVRVRVRVWVWARVTTPGRRGWQGSATAAVARPPVTTNSLSTIHCRALGQIGRIGVDPRLTTSNERGDTSEWGDGYSALCVRSDINTQQQQQQGRKAEKGKKKRRKKISQRGYVGRWISPSPVSRHTWTQRNVTGGAGRDRVIARLQDCKTAWLQCYRTAAATTRRRRNVGLLSCTSGTMGFWDLWKTITVSRLEAHPRFNAPSWGAGSGYSSPAKV